MDNVIKINTFNFNKLNEITNKEDEYIIFVGLNVKGGIEISSDRYLNQLIKQLDENYKPVKIIWFYEQGIYPTHLNKIFDFLFKNRKIKMVFLNEPNDRYLNILNKFSNIYRNILFWQNIHKFRDDIENLDMYDIITTPILSNVYYYKKLLEETNPEIFYFPFIQYKPRYIIPIQYRFNTLLMPKQINERIDFELTYKFLNSGIIDEVYYVNRGDNQFRDLDIKLKEIPFIEPKNLDHLYNQFKFICYFPNYELFGIFMIDQMQCGTFPIFSIIKRFFGGFGKDEIFHKYGIIYNDHLSFDENLKLIKEQMDNKTEEEQFKMSKETLIQFGQERIINLFRSVLKNQRIIPQ